MFVVPHHIRHFIIWGQRRLRRLAPPIPQPTLRQLLPLPRRLSRNERRNRLLQPAASRQTIAQISMLPRPPLVRAICSTEQRQGSARRGDIFGATFMHVRSQTNAPMGMLCFLGSSTYTTQRIYPRHRQNPGRLRLPRTSIPRTSSPPEPTG